MIRKHKKFEWPRKLFDKPRILEENKLVAKYGLKNKREIWKIQSKVKHFRTRAKNLITADQEEQQKFLYKLSKIGLKVNNIADVLALDKESLLKRRLPSILVEKKMANTSKQARQMVVHKRVRIKDKVINIPSYLVKIEDEKLINVRKKVKKLKIKEAEQPSSVETSENVEVVDEENSQGSESKSSEVVEVRVNA